METNLLFLNLKMDGSILLRILWISQLLSLFRVFTEAFPSLFSSLLLFIIFHILPYLLDLFKVEDQNYIHYIMYQHIHINLFFLFFTLKKKYHFQSKSCDQRSSMYVQENWIIFFNVDFLKITLTMFCLHFIFW